MIAREGLIPIAVTGAAALAAAHFAGIPWSLPLWVLLAYLVYLFRDFVVDIPNIPLAVLSPGDGRVVEISEERDGWLDRDALRVRVALAGVGIGVLRSPIEGKVVNYWTSAQPFNEPDRIDAAGDSPNCYSIQVQADEGDDVVFAVSSLRPISRFKLYVAPGERIGIGQRCGFIYFGSVVDIFVPSDTKIEAQPGHAAHSGSTVLGSLVRRPPGAAESGAAS